MQDDFLEFLERLKIFLEEEKRKAGGQRTIDNINELLNNVEEFNKFMTKEELNQKLEDLQAQITHLQLEDDILRAENKKLKEKLETVKSHIMEAKYYLDQNGLDEQDKQNGLNFIDEAINLLNNNQNNNE